VKLSCTKENLHQGLAITSHVSSKNINYPILNNVLLKADKGGLKLIATNLNISITCNIRGKIEQIGDYTIPSKLCFDYVNLLPNERIDIDLIDEALLLTCGSQKTKIKGEGSSEFPIVPPPQDGETYAVPVAALGTALSQVLFAAATNESRPELAGICLGFHNEASGKGTITLAATDSYRLSERIVKTSGGSEQQKDIIVPQRTLLELARVISILKDDIESGENVEMSVSENQIVFRYGGVEIISNLVEGKYPDYRQVIPSDSKTTVNVEKSELQKAVKAVSLFAKTGLFDVKLRIDPQEQVIELRGEDATRGENVIRIPAAIEGVESDIAVNYRYLLDGLTATRTDKVVMKFIDKRNPCVILPHESEDAFRYIVMPIRQ
jgi:DNA polymerase III subunit beta